MKTVAVLFAVVGGLFTFLVDGEAEPLAGAQAPEHDTTRRGGCQYGGCRFAEKLGVAFGLDSDIVPDEPFTEPWPDLDETGKPRFEVWLSIANRCRLAHPAAVTPELDLCAVCWTAM
ncbi:MAG TPA: hypothetical protein P5534_05740 [Candidatus Paceibacterota bacterium]|nr:hypothetical protein [Candidatus Paceibacterota bacterium]HRZ56430.1 hypothetical protein [Candidatus Paceibacterota bacterium]